MKTTMQYSVGDEVAHVPSNEADEFNAVAKEQNITPEPIFTYRVSNKKGDVQQLDVPKAEYEEFAKTAGDNGYKIEPLRMMTMDDGTERYFSARELRSFMRSDEYLNSTDGAEAKKRDAEAKARIAAEEANTPGFWENLGRNLFTAGGIRETAEDSDWAKPYAYANDVANALVGGLLKGSAKIEQGFGHLVGSDAIVKDAKEGAAAVDENLPTDMLDTKKPGAANKVLQVGKNVAEVTGEFAPSLLPGAGAGYAASLVGSGSTIRYMQVYDDAIAHGCDPDKAVGLASLGAAVDAGQNMLLMGKFKGIWKGEQATLAQAAKEGLVKRLMKDTVKVGAIMSGGGMAGDVIDQAAEGAYWLDVGRTAKVGFDQFIEGGLFHLVNTGAHNATKIDWGSDTKGIPAGASRDMMEAPEGRALVFANSPDAARAIYRARKNGENVSRKMIEDLGLSGDTARTVEDRNALGDRLMADYDAFKERVRTKMDDVQAGALADEIASRSDEGVNNPAFEKVWFKAVEQIKDARELDDPERRKQIVDEACKVTETKGERLQRQKEVAKAIRERQAEYAQEAQTAKIEGELPPKVENGEVKTPEVAKSAEIQPVAASEKVEMKNEPPAAPSAPTDVLERHAESGGLRKNGTDEDWGKTFNSGYSEWLKANNLKNTSKNYQKFNQSDERMALQDRWREDNEAASKARYESTTDTPENVAEWQDGRFSKMRYGTIKTREDYERAVKEFDEIAAKGELERDSIGALNMTSARRMAHELASSSFAKPEEAARFKAMVDGKAESTSAETPKKEAKAPARDVMFEPFDYKMNNLPAGTVVEDVDGKRYTHDVHGGWVDESGKTHLSDVAFKDGYAVVSKGDDATVTAKPKAPAKADEAKKVPLVAEKPAEKPVEAQDVQKNGTSSRTLSEAALELASNRDRQRFSKDEKEIGELAKRATEVEDEIERMREPGKEPEPFTGKPNAAKAAKIVGEFVDTEIDERTKKPRRENLTKVFHDKKSGVAVATNGRMLIASKHGYDPNGESHPEFPNWQAVVPAEKDTPRSIKVNPTALAKSCKDVLRLARATGVKKNSYRQPMVALRFGDYVNVYQAEYVAKFAKAMEANGITEIQSPDKPNWPMVARNGDTTVVLMPYRLENGEAFDGSDHPVGRFDGGTFIVNGHNGRLITAPDRTDTRMRDMLKIERESFDKSRAESIGKAKKEKFFTALVEAQRKGMTDPAEIYNTVVKAKGAEDFDKLNDENKACFTEWVKTTDPEALASKVADYLDRNQLWFRDAPKRMEKLEKQIAAEDEIEGLIQRRQEAMDFLGIKPKKPVVDAEAEKMEDDANEAIKAENDYNTMMKQVREWSDGKQGHQNPLNALRLYIDTHEDVIDEKMMIDAVRELGVSEEDVGNWLGGRDRSHKFNVDVAVKAFEKPIKTESDRSAAIYDDVGGLISEHLKAQATATNNAKGRAFKAKAKDALVKYLSELSDEDYADVKAGLKSIMADNGLDPAESGYVQAIFNAETAKRNVAKKDAPKTAPAASKSLADLIDEDIKNREKEDWEAADKSRAAMREKMKSIDTDGLKAALGLIQNNMRGKKPGDELSRLAGIESELRHEIESRSGGKTVAINTELEKYVATKKPMEAARIVKTLQKMRDYGGSTGVASEDGLIESALAANAHEGKNIHVSAGVTVSKNGKPTIYFTLGDETISATAANYAKARGVPVDENALARAAERAKMITMFGSDELNTSGRTDSDADIQKRIDWIEPKVKTLGNMRYDNGMTMKERYDALKAIKDARIKRGDWSVEEKNKAVDAAQRKLDSVKTDDERIVAEKELSSAIDARDATTVAEIEKRNADPKLRAQFIDKNTGAEAEKVVDFVRAIESGDENGVFAGKGKHFRLAKTSDVLKECGLTGDYFTIRGGVILRHKGKDAEHAITADEWVDISTALTEKKPQLVEKYGTDGKSYRIWTEAKIGGNTAIVGVDVKNVGRDMEVNSIATAFGASVIKPKIDSIVYPKNAKEMQSVLTRLNSGRYPASPSTADSIPKPTAETKAEPGKYTDSVYETYKSAPTFREGAIAFAEDTIDAVRGKLNDQLEAAKKSGDQENVRVLTYKIEKLKDERDELKDTIDVGATKSATHVALRKVLERVNDIEPIEGFEDISDFQPRRGESRIGIKSVDEYNDNVDDIVESIYNSKRFFDTKDEADEEVAETAKEYLEQPIAFDKGVYDGLSAGDKRYFDKMVDDLMTSHTEVIEQISEERAGGVDMEAARKFVEDYNNVAAFEESARKMNELMRDSDGRPILFTEKSHATEMAHDGVKRAVKAFVSRDAAEATAATEMINLAIENGGKFPTKKQIAEMAKDMPEEMRATFTRNADALRTWAEKAGAEPSIADEATKLADDVDAEIEAEEKGGGEKPDAAPRGRGTGALSQDEPKPQGTVTTGKVRGIVTPQSFLKEARKMFPDVAIRGKGTAHMAKWAAGHFEATTRTIRSRDMNAIRTITHELGHDLEYLTRYDLLRNPAAKRDLSDLGHALYPSGPGMPKPNSYIGEGFAEYVRGYICNAPDLATVAPDMDAWFKGDFKAKHPEIVRKIDRLRDMVQTMKEQSAADTVRGFRHPATTVVERAWKKVTEFASSENWNDAASTILKGMKKSGIDKLYHWQDKFKELEAAVKAGDTVRAQQLSREVSDEVENHPYLFPTITRGTASQRVMDMARHGTTTLLGNHRTGESLKEIFADFSHKEQEAFKDYAIARHGIENYYNKGLEFGMPKDVLEEVVRQYDSPKFQQALQRMTGYSHRILHLGVDAGLISQETYDKIVAEHPIYVRITRRKADDGAGTKQGGAAINKRTGGFENILDPIDAMLMDQEKYLRACFQAKSMQLIVQAAQRAKAANLLSIRNNGGPNTSTVNPRSQSHIAVSAYWPIEVPNAQEKVTFGAGKLKQGLSDAAADYAGRTGEDPIPLEEFINDLATYTDPQGRMTQLSIFRDKPSHGKHNLVSVYVDGKLHTYELPDMKWANMLTDVYDKSDFNWLERTFGLATAGIRLGATTVNPGFAVRNGIRDSLHAAVMSESGAVPMLGTLNGMLNQLTGKEAAQMFRSMGGHMSDLVGVTKEQKWHHGGQVALAQNPVQSLQAYGAIDWALMKPVIKAASDVLSIPELGPRVREFNGILQKCRNAGLTEDAAAMLAMSHAKDISIDFQRAGRYMKHINHFIPFSNAMWRGTEQTVRNLGVLSALPHQFEDNNLARGMKTTVKGLAYITSWMATLAMLEMAGDEKDRRRAFERDPVEKWEYAHVGDWRIPLPFELGYVFGAIPKAAIYEMYGDDGAMKECLTAFNQAMPTKYASPDTAIGSISGFTPWIGLLKNEDYRGRAIVPEHIMENRVKTDWYTQYTTELSKRIGKAVGQSPAQLEYLLDSYTGGLYRRTALAIENIGDTSRLQEGRGFSMLDTLRARPQANRLVSDFYKFGEEAKQKLGSGILSLEDYGKFASMNGVKEELTERFGEMRAIRADKSIPLAEQDKRVQAIAEDVNETIRNFNARDDYRQRGIAYAASHLTGSTLESLDENTRQQYTAILKDVPTNEIVQSLIKFGNEMVMVKHKGVKIPQRRWSNKNVNERVGRLLMLMQNR